MNTSIIRPVIAGLLIGTALFFIPFFVLRVAVFILIVGLIFRLFAGRRRWNRNFMDRRLAFIDRVRNMSDEEYNQFKQQSAYGCGYHQKPDSTNTQNVQQ